MPRRLHPLVVKAWARCITSRWTLPLLATAWRCAAAAVLPAMSLCGVTSHHCASLMQGLLRKKHLHGGSWRTEYMVLAAGVLHRYKSAKQRKAHGTAVAKYGSESKKVCSSGGVVFLVVLPLWRNLTRTGDCRLASTHPRCLFPLLVPRCNVQQSLSLPWRSRRLLLLRPPTRA